MGIETAWTTIINAINTGWTTFSTTATSWWNTITSAVKTAVSSAQTGMREILRDAGGERNRREETLLRALIDELRRARKDPPKPGAPVQVTQNIYADQTSYAGQQREAARQFRQIVREMV